MEKIEIIKIMAKSTMSIILRIIFFTAIGIILNWNFLFFNLGDIVSRFGVSMPGARAGIIGAIVALLVNYKILFIFLFFFIGMPLLYFLVGKGFGFKKALKKIFDSAKPELYEYITKIALDLKDKVQDQSKLQRKTIKKSMNKLPEMPKKFKSVLLYLLSKLPFAELIVESSTSEEFSEINFETSMKIMTKVLDEKIDDAFFSPPYPFLGIVAAVNIVAFVLIIISI